jgi:hypothetical protein
MFRFPDIYKMGMAVAPVPDQRYYDTIYTERYMGLPQENAFLGVLRQAMATDRLEPSSVYFGTGSGTLYASIDEGDSWRCIAQHLPSISSVETLAVET